MEKMESYNVNKTALLLDVMCQTFDTLLTLFGPEKMEFSLKKIEH